ncbi:nucleoside-diphosphate-sugar epimerase [Burkholderiales bacterium JOSHI_001]|nr:nucleoside-diphosphate-sugar epimerase [Burkholderiales bacterium JOSHI_001]
MKILVVGGSRFVGHHFVQAALAQGHELTLFNRGQSGPAPAGVEHRRGDRRVDLSALKQGRWDAVVDTCGYLPAEVAALADLLHGRVGRYVFISSVSVYASAARPNDEGCALGHIDDPDTTVVDGRTYGPLKALCEAQVQRRFGDLALVLRPGLVVGPQDPTHRFTHWPARLATACDGEAVLAPGRPSDPIQWIDVRDLAHFALLGLGTALAGPFNVASAPGSATMGELLATCAQAAGVAPRLVWHDMAALQAQGLAPWTDLPLALPDDDAHRGFMAHDTRKALAAGLRIRPLADTVADTLAWWRSLPARPQTGDRPGLDGERERAVLAALATRPT